MNSPGQLIFTAYRDDENNIKLGISPEFDGYTTGREYFIILDDTMLKMTLESAIKFGTPSEEVRSDE